MMMYAPDTKYLRLVVGIGNGRLDEYQSLAENGGENAAQISAPDGEWEVAPYLCRYGDCPPLDSVSVFGADGV